MANELELLAEWTFIQEVSIPKDVSELLVPGEEAVAAYKTVRDTAGFLNKRLIVKDAQGLTGKKIEIYSLPYSSVVMWSIENAGKLLDINSEVELWTKAGHIKLSLKKGIDIRKFDNILASEIL